jgi:acylphosphatase
MPTKRYVISGVVQGVNFRFYTQREGRRLGLAGWVMNLPDGRVAALAQGDEEKLAAFGRFLQEGSPGARVEKVEAKEAKPDANLADFELRIYPPPG